MSKASGDVEVGVGPDATFDFTEKDPTLTSTTKHEPTETYHRNESTDDTSDEKSVAIIPPAPDGGLRAWLQVLSGHLVVFNAWGYINSFGIFQSYYVSTLSQPQSTVAWIGSFQVFLVFFIGTFSGRALDAGYYRSIALAGALIQILGVFMTSLCTSYWQLFLAQGLCQGIGDGLIFCPTVSLVATYFDKRRAFAIAVVASGAATGGIVFPLIAQQLLDKIGFGWTIRVMGLVILVNDFIIFSLAKTRLPPRRSGALIELAAFKELPYTLFTIGMLFTLWATYFAYYYVRSYALTILHVTQTTSFNLLLILNAIGVPGRWIPALLADRFFSPLTVLIPSVVAGAICIFSWYAVHDLASDYVWVVIFGWFGASIQGLFPASLASLTTDPKKTGTRMGMVMSIMSFAVLTGPPLAGALVQRADGSYLAATVWGGVCLVVGAGILMAAGIAKKRRDEKIGVGE